MESLLTVLIKRDGREAARSTIEDMLQQFDAGEDPEEILYEYGLEPDYIMDLIDYSQNMPMRKHHDNRWEWLTL
jgi:hypothetical protein